MDFQWKMSIIFLSRHNKVESKHMLCVWDKFFERLKAERNKEREGILKNVYEVSSKVLAMRFI